MRRSNSLPEMTLGKAFAQFLNSASFAWRTRESYTDDLALLLTPYSQADVSVPTAEIIQAYLAHQEQLAPTTYNRRLAALRSFLRFLQTQGYSVECCLLASGANQSVHGSHGP